MKWPLQHLAVEQDIRNVLWLKSEFYRGLGERLSGEPERCEVPQVKARVTIQGIHVVDEKLARPHSHETTLPEERPDRPETLPIAEK